MSDKPKCIDAAECASGCGEGWYPLIEALVNFLDQIVPGWEPAQVKEKFGTLRFYVNWPDPTTIHEKWERESDEDYEARMDRIRDSWEKVVSLAEGASSKVCEICGEPGELRTGGYWLHTFCDDHQKKYEETKTMRDLT